MVVIVCMVPVEEVWRAVVGPSRPYAQTFIKHMILALAVDGLIIGDPRRDVRNLVCGDTKKQPIELFIPNCGERTIKPIGRCIHKSLCVSLNKETNVTHSHVDRS